MKKYLVLMILGLSLTSTVASADSVEESLVKAACDQTDVNYALRFNDDGIISACSSNGESILKQSVVPAAEKPEDLLAFRVRLVLNTCENKVRSFEIPCLQSAAIELQKSYAQKDVDIEGSVMSCPTYERYFASPKANAEFQSGCIVKELKRAAKIDS